METLKQKIKRLTSEEVAICAYDAGWPEMFFREREHLRRCLPGDLIVRIEHFGSTAIPGIFAKPIIDMLVEVSSLQRTKREIPPILEGQGYEYFWRPTFGDDVPPFYAWFIKRDEAGKRTHHIHMVEKHFTHWERLLFRDYLIARPELAKEYGTLKIMLSKKYPNDRVAYTSGKTEFIDKVMQRARSK